ncbi:MAG: NAD-dependent epimerase/dehydratase family protein [Pirellulaceae bacterium]
MTKVLVTGYGGFLGAEVSRQLLESGYEVRGLARGGYPELEALGVECMQGDIVDPNVAEAAVGGCQAVVHTAAKAGVWGVYEEYYAINTRAAVQLFKTAGDAGVQAFVQTSSPSVTFDGQHQSGVDESVPYPTKWLCHYPNTKAEAEKRILEASQEERLYACALRPHLIWGYEDPHLFPRVVERTLSGRLRRVGSGTNLIDVVHVTNAARAHVSAVERLLDRDTRLNGNALFITDGQPVECWAWISKILEAADVEVPSKSISFKAAYGIGACLEVAYRLTGKTAEPPMTRFVAAQLALDHYFDISRARNLLDYQPDIDTDAELEKCHPWLQALAAGHSKRN